MNDPGLDDAIDQNAKKVEREIHEDEELEANDEQTFLNPRYVGPLSASFLLRCVHWACTVLLIELDSRWWFASTAFPLLAVRNRAP